MATVLRTVAKNQDTMKAIDEMNNVEKAYLLAKLFPDSLKELVAFVQRLTEKFREQEKHLRSIWADRTLITANFWYDLVGNTEKTLKRNNVMLCKSARIFSDQLFDGYDAIFMIDCLVAYADRAECTPKLKEAIGLLFGNQKMITIINEDHEEKM